MNNNHFQLKGNLAKDAVIIKNDEKNPFVSFTVAVKDGKKATTYLDVVSWDKQCIEWMKNAKKGQYVYADGFITNYKVKEGEYKTSLVATFTRPFEQETKENNLTNTPTNHPTSNIDDIGFETDAEEYQGYSYE